MSGSLLRMPVVEIKTGPLPPSGMKTESMKGLAVATGVSVITVKRAYLELERDGVIVTQQGKGSWVSENEGCIDQTFLPVLSASTS